MDPNAPPSPAPSHHDTYGLQELANHNAATSYPRDMTAMGDPPRHAISLPPSRYSTPPIPPRLGQSGSPDHTDLGLAMSQPSYGNQPSYGGGLNPSPYGPLPDEIQSRDANRTHPYGTPATSPPTPKRRSVRAAARRRHPAGNDSSEHDSPEPESPRRKKKNKATRELVIDKPLSVLAGEMGIEVEDMHKYVTRSVQERQQEINRMGIKDRGRVKRPMNSFMLYRKAYQSMTKKFCGDDNHQVVSRVCGDSWRHLESDAFKAEFERLAKLDRSGHKAAWPDYKFKPAKPRGKKAQEDEDDDPNWTFRRVHRDEDPALQEYMSREHTPSMGMSDMPSRHASPPGQHRGFSGSPASHSPYQPQRYLAGSSYPHPPLGAHGMPEFDFNTPPGGMPFGGYAGRGEPHVPSRLDMTHTHAGQGSHMGVAYGGVAGGAVHFSQHHGLPGRHSPPPGAHADLIYSPSDLLPGGGEGDFASYADNYHHVAPHQQQQYEQHHQHQPRHQPQFYGQGYHLAGQGQDLQPSRQSSEPPLVDPSLLGPADAPAASAAPEYGSFGGKVKTEHLATAPELGALGGLNETLMAGGAHEFDEWEITEWPAGGGHWAPQR